MPDKVLYLIDDRGKNGEYLAFLHAYRRQLPSHEIEVFTHWQEMYDAIVRRQPDLILADMRFDLIPCEQLYGNIDELAQTEHFCGNHDRAEAQVRGMQGLLICRALRENNLKMPVLLFASLDPRISGNVENALAPLRVVEGLSLDKIKQAMWELGIRK